MDTVEEAISPEKFDVLSFVQNTSYPTNHVTVFTDITAAREYTRVSKELNDAKDSDSANALGEELNGIEERLKKTSLTFKLRGFAPGIVDAIIQAHSDPENPESGAEDAHLISKAIVYVSDSEGNRDERVWTAEDVLEVKRYLAEGEFQKILSGVANVIFNAAVFEQATDAGFLGGRPNVAPELSGSTVGSDSV